jgi:hypothetical protein
VVARAAEVGTVVARAAEVGGGVPVLCGVSTVIGRSWLSSYFGCMLIPTTPTTPPTISAPSRIVRGSRMSSTFRPLDGLQVRAT